jgi:hypothetical protein
MKLEQRRGRFEYFYSLFFPLNLVLAKKISYLSVRMLIVKVINQAPIMLN